MLEDIKSGLAKIKGKFEHLRGYLDVDARLKEISHIEGLMSAQDFWQNMQKANQVISRLKGLKSTTEPFQRAFKEYEEIEELAAIMDDGDEASLKELNSDLSGLKKKIDMLEFKSLLSGEHDLNNAILSINAGAGGTESCDWASMLIRMYMRWATQMKYTVQNVDLQPGEEAGIKNATVIIKGEWAYGYLKGESGVHRLVRISPFDSNKRRHTSFASVDVIAEIEGEVSVKIEDKDIKVDVYRSSGPGGQSVNTTDSAVRITHIPTGIVVQCQNERSQIKNKATAMKVLKARLYERQQRELKEKMEKQYAAKQKIEWGSQIRSYVFHPYNMVKDHRTNEETSNTQTVMDGGIDRFIQAYLKKRKS
ncbi:MAG: peptide chain release factor 2 [Candidatus Omnitrophica bacterium]|nr:peptide chain release factor 2 [Candidatus Omnitrophota bacterium]